MNGKIALHTLIEYWIGPADTDTGAQKVGGPLSQSLCLNWVLLKWEIKISESRQVPIMF